MRNAYMSLKNTTISFINNNPLLAASLIIAGLFILSVVSVIVVELLPRKFGFAFLLGESIAIPFLVLILSRRSYLKRKEKNWQRICENISTNSIIL